jgi:hypothetical protein
LTVKRRLVQQSFLVAIEETRVVSAFGELGVAEEPLVKRYRTARVRAREPATVDVPVRIAAPR